MGRLIDADVFRNKLVEMTNDPFASTSSPLNWSHAYESVMVELDRMPNAQGWISVDDRLPDSINAESNSNRVTDMVLATTCGYILFGYFDIYKYNGTWEFVSVDTDFDFDRCVTVTHWMPLPEPPKEE